MEQVSNLVEQARNGNLDAFGCLIEQHQAALFGAVYGMLGNVSDAQDVVQEVCIQAWSELGSLRDAEKFPAWLYRIAQNRSRNFLTRQRGRTVSIEKFEQCIQLTSDSQAFEQQAATALVIRDAIKSLTEVNRLTAILFYISGYSVREIAAILDVPSGTVKRRLHDARNQLRQKMIDLVGVSLQPVQQYNFMDGVALFHAIWNGDEMSV